MKSKNVRVESAPSDPSSSYHLLGVKNRLAVITSGHVKALHKEIIT